MDGGVAQLGEHLPCKQGVMGSIPIISTTGQSPDPMIGVESAMRFFSPRESRSDESRKEHWASPDPTSGEASAMWYCNPRESRSDESREGKGKMVKLEGKKPSRFCRDGTNEENQMRNGL